MLIAIWVFSLLMNLASFGGPVTIEVSATSEDGCKKLLKTLTKEMSNNGMRFTASECQSRS